MGACKAHTREENYMLVEKPQQKTSLRHIWELY